MLFGVAAVNKYYGYYETWGAVVADFTSRGVQSIPQAPALGAGSAQQFDQLLGNAINTQQAAQTGAEISVTVTGAASHITRDVLIYLPPQYFQKQYASYRFPAIELIHGQPGEPQDWLAAMDVQTTLQNLIASHRADPVVLVMPDVNGGRKISLQCLNQVGGPADDTFVALDVPRFIAARIRVQAPGQAWGIAGYSEGGYCAANLALRHPEQFGFAGVLSGYFRPMDNRVEYKNAIKRVDPFHFNAALRRQNSPLDIRPSASCGQPDTAVLGRSGPCGAKRRARRHRFRQGPQGTGSGNPADHHAERCTQRHRVAQHDGVDAGVDDAPAGGGRRGSGLPGLHPAAHGRGANRPSAHQPPAVAAESRSSTRACTTARWCNAARSARCRPSSRYSSPRHWMTCGKRSP